MSNFAGFVSLHRKIIDWEWYTDSNTFRLFMHCLLKANYKNKNWRGFEIKRGSFVTSYQKISHETNLSIQQVRTALKKLKSTCEITYKSTGCYSIITLNNYNQYQQDNTQNNEETTEEATQSETPEQQSGNKQVTTTNNDNKDNNKINKKTKKKFDSTKVLRTLFESEFKENLDLEPVLLKWLDYKKAKTENYKSDASIASLIKKVINLSGGDFSEAEALVENAMSNNWSGIYPIKTIAQKSKVSTSSAQDVDYESRARD